MQKDILNPHAVLRFHHIGFNAWKGNSHVPSVKFACGEHGSDLTALCQASGCRVEMQTSIPSISCLLNFMLFLPFQKKKKKVKKKAHRQNDF